MSTEKSTSLGFSMSIGKAKTNKLKEKRIITIFDESKKKKRRIDDDEEEREEDQTHIELITEINGTEFQV